MNSRRFPVYFALALVLVALYARLASVSGLMGYPLDDGWIHQTYARNWAETGQLAYVVDLPSAGSTAPLWTWLISLGYRLRTEPLAWMYALGVAWMMLAANRPTELAEA